MQDLDEAVRKYLAWESILAERTNLNLSPFQVSQAETQKTAAESAVTARLPETYQWLLAPIQTSPDASVTWEALRLTGTDALAVRASKKLRTDELFLTSFAPTRLKMELERVPLWRGNHVQVKQLVEDFARYLYLPRLKNPAVLLNSISDGVNLLTWSHDSFGLADSYDETDGRYQGLRCGQVVILNDTHASEMLVKPDVASAQLATESVSPSPSSERDDIPDTSPADPTAPKPAYVPPGSTKPKRFHGTAVLDATRVGRDASRIADEIIAHLSGLVGSNVTVTIEIQAEIPDGAPDHIVRTVTENSQTLRFTSHGFEIE